MAGNQNHKRGRATASSAAAAADDDEGDDYMGDLSLFLSSEDITSSRMLLPPTKQKPIAPEAKPKKPKCGSWQERRKIERDRRQLDEDDRTRASLEAAIPSSNIGFRMLQMMGYNPGSALGKDQSGRREPLGLDIRRSRAGIGRETPAEERARREREREERKRSREEDSVEAMEEFGTWQRMLFRSRRVVADYRKAEAALAQLENREEAPPEKDENDAEKDEDEEEEEVVTEEDLHTILIKLREEHRYCLYCGFQYESAEDLEANCPGLEEDVH